MYEVLSFPGNSIHSTPPSTKTKGTWTSETLLAGCLKGKLSSYLNNRFIDTPTVYFTSAMFG